jgi:hypothetical protein
MNNYSYIIKYTNMSLKYDTSPSTPALDPVSAQVISIAASDVTLVDNLNDNLNNEIDPMIRLRQFFQDNEIDERYFEDVSSLDMYDIVIIADDSSSMNQSAGRGKTRWEELCESISKVVQLGSIFDDDGIDLFFLNREGKTNVTSYDIVHECFQKLPRGYTPLTRCVKEIYAQYASNPKPVILVIATDGEPSDDNGRRRIDEFKSCIRNRDVDKFFINILICSDQSDEIGYLDDLDNNVKHVDAIDDFFTEKKQVQAIQGADFSYTYGDHIVRLLLGAPFPKWDALDEKKLGGSSILSRRNDDFNTRTSHQPSTQPTALQQYSEIYYGETHNYQSRFPHSQHQKPKSCCLIL